MNVFALCIVLAIVSATDSTSAIESNEYYNTPPNCTKYIGKDFNTKIFDLHPIFLNMGFLVRNDVVRNHGNDKDAVVKGLRETVQLCNEIFSRQLNLGFHVRKVVFAEDAFNLTYTQNVPSALAANLTAFLNGTGTDDGECEKHYSNLKEWWQDIGQIAGFKGLSVREIAAWTGITSCFKNHSLKGVATFGHMASRTKAAAAVRYADDASMGVLKRASLLMHEWAHLLGYYHSHQGFMRERLHSAKKADKTYFFLDGDTYFSCLLLSALHEFPPSWYQPTATDEDACRWARALPANSTVNWRQPVVFRRSDFTVSLKCIPGFHGTLIVTKCAASGLPFTIVGNCVEKRGHTLQPSYDLWSTPCRGWSGLCHHDTGFDTICKSTCSGCTDEDTEDTIQRLNIMAAGDELRVDIVLGNETLRSKGNGANDGNAASISFKKVDEGKFEIRDDGEKCLTATWWACGVRNNVAWTTCKEDANEMWGYSEAPNAGENFRFLFTFRTRDDWVLQKYLSPFGSPYFGLNYLKNAKKRADSLCLKSQPRVTF